ncbi:hydrogenase [Burkholderia sp. WAC0059]|uniref:nitrogen fixation protein NifQ n=1 Tax=Burkholderia sp. WAC0059 TaxID=2066022 RepID=UPI000C7EDC77|nr:nitrogen fixation protein NifQ [Burkholderia sp. WAC0059]PLZ04119.1 hydrogenase [Burkholderia sp. WAC0059]
MAERPDLPKHTFAGQDFESAARARCDALTGGRTEAGSSDARLFARLVAARDVRGELALLGLPPDRLAALYRRHFADFVETAAPRAVSPAVADAGRLAFTIAMRDLLLAFRSPDVEGDDAHCLATIIAHACLRPDHLWRDLGLDGRDDVTHMLERYFPALVARNVDGLRWKKFLARELALATGATPGPAPGCPGCEDFGFCFPEGR